MSFVKCEPKQLANTLAAVKPAVSSRSAVQALAGVRITVGADKVWLHTTDMDLSLMRPIPGAEANGLEDVVVPHALLVDAVRLFKNHDQITLTRNHATREDPADEVIVSGGNRKIRLQTLRREDFPGTPGQGGRVILYANGDELAPVIARAGKFASKDETRPVLTGMQLDWQEDEPVLVATDGYRLCKLRLPVELNVARAQPEDNRVTVPARALAVAAKLMKGERVEMVQDDRHVTLNIGETVLHARVIDGQYPNYRQLFPETFEHSVSIPVRQFGEACEVAVKFSQKNVPARLALNGNAMLHGYTPDVGGFEEILEGATVRMGVEARELEIGLNPEFLRDIVKDWQGDEVVVNLISPLRPAMFEDTDGRYLLMPVRLNV